MRTPASERAEAAVPAPFERVYGVRPARVHALAWGSVALLAIFTGMLASPSSHALASDLLTNEHGPVELLTFLGFLAAGALSARLAWRERGRSAPRAVVVGYALFAMYCVFAAMEEISWGQSLFDFGARSWLANLNEQGETNLHDLPGIMDLNSAFVLLFGIAGLVGSRLWRRERFRALAAPPALAPLFAVIAAMGAIETINDFWFLGRRVAPVIGALSEAVELFGAVSCLACVWLNGRMLDRQWEHPAASTHAA